MSASTTNYSFAYLVSGDQLSGSYKLPFDASQIDSSLYIEHLNISQVASDLYDFSALQNTGVPRRSIGLERETWDHWNDMGENDWVYTGLSASAIDSYRVQVASGHAYFSGRRVASVQTVYDTRIGTPTISGITSASTGGTLSASAIYYYGVTAVNASGETSYNTPATITTGSSSASNSATITWTLIPGASTYRVYRGSTASSLTLISSASAVTSASYLDTGTSTASTVIPTSSTAGQASQTFYLRIYADNGLYWSTTDDSASGVLLAHVLTSSSSTSGSISSIVDERVTTGALSIAAISDGIFTSSGSGAVPLTINGAVGQIAHLQEWRTSSGSIVSYVTSTGQLWVQGLSGMLKATSGSIVGGGTTSDVPEGSNLYFTDARAYGAIAVSATGFDYSSGTLSFTSGYSLPTDASQTAWNLTATRVTQSLISTASPTLGGLTLTGLSGVIKATAGVLAGSATTSDLTEGSNLYFTTARAYGAITVSASGLTYSSGSLTLTSGFIIPTSTEESHWNTAYANAGQDVTSSASPTFAAVKFTDATTVLSQTSASILQTTHHFIVNGTLVVGSLTGVLKASSGSIVGSATTSDLAEGSNLYFTTARAYDAVSVSVTGLTYSTGSLTLTSGYVIPTTTEETNWNTAYTNAGGQSLVSTASPTFAAVFFTSSDVALYRSSGSMLKTNYNMTVGLTLTAASMTGTLTTASQPSITSVGTLTNLVSTGAVSLSSGSLTISANGDLTKIHNVAYVWPSSQAAGNNYIIANDGSGNLSWTGQEQFMTFGMDGVIAVATGKGRVRFPWAVTILGISVTMDTAPTGASAVFDINKNGTTIFTTQSNRPGVLIGANVTAAEVTNMDVTAFSAGDYITADIDQIGSTVAGSDLTIIIRYCRA